jgi:MFS transporter, DHA2 family, multidrug resistance protein
MASGTADLQRDLGGAVMQSIFGALLTAGYAAAAAAALADAPPSVDFTTSVQNQLTMSFAGAEEIAKQYPQYSTQIIQAAKESFLAGDQWAYLAGIVAVLMGATLVFFKFPHRDEEHRLLDEYPDQDAPAAAPPAATPAPAPVQPSPA